MEFFIFILIIFLYVLNFAAGKFQLLLKNILKNLKMVLFEGASMGLRCSTGYPFIPCNPYIGLSLILPFLQPETLIPLTG